MNSWFHRSRNKWPYFWNALKNVHIYLITMRKKRNYLEKKNEFYVHITMIAEIRLAALLARATLLVYIELKELYASIK